MKMKVEIELKEGVMKVKYIGREVIESLIEPYLLIGEESAFIRQVVVVVVVEEQRTMRNESKHGRETQKQQQQ
jgi:hypothetical protein